ncbi:hypothetical protein B0H13DRAFT_2263367 [Mycena leptocephala]|nr:hypothetical protein B0H13DRAFT_2263367 [Mycena leptocephala]
MDNTYPPHEHHSASDLKTYLFPYPLGVQHPSESSQAQVLSRLIRFSEDADPSDVAVNDKLLQAHGGEMNDSAGEGVEPDLRDKMIRECASAQDIVTARATPKTYRDLVIEGRFTPRRTIAEKELRTQEQDETDGKDENWEIIGIGLVFCGAEALNARESYMKTAAIPQRQNVAEEQDGHVQSSATSGTAADEGLDVPED